MNDLYNTQDVILLCEIIKNRFQLMHDKYGFNPRKGSSASSLSGSIERDLSKVIIALPTSNETDDIFEQTFAGGFNCVNTRLAFDTDILLPNCHEKGDDVLAKDYNYKVYYKLKLDSDEKWRTRRMRRNLMKHHHYIFRRVSSLLRILSSSTFENSSFTSFSFI